MNYLYDEFFKFGETLRVWYRIAPNVLQLDSGFERHFKQLHWSNVTKCVLLEDIKTFSVFCPDYCL